MFQLILIKAFFSSSVSTTASWWLKTITPDSSLSFLFVSLRRWSTCSQIKMPSYCLHLQCRPDACDWRKRRHTPVCLNQRPDSASRDWSKKTHDAVLVKNDHRFCLHKHKNNKKRNAGGETRCCGEETDGTEPVWECVMWQPLLAACFTATQSSHYLASQGRKRMLPCPRQQLTDDDNNSVSSNYG